MIKLALIINKMSRLKLVKIKYLISIVIMTPRIIFGVVFYFSNLKYRRKALRLHKNKFLFPKQFNNRFLIFCQLSF